MLIYIGLAILVLALGLFLLAMIDRSNPAKTSGNDLAVAIRKEQEVSQVVPDEELANSVPGEASSAVNSDVPTSEA